jgi:hypothetical protein
MEMNEDQPHEVSKGYSELANVGEWRHHVHVCRYSKAGRGEGSFSVEKREGLGVPWLEAGGLGRGRVEMD